MVLLMATVASGAEGSSGSEQPMPRYGVFAAVGHDRGSVGGDTDAEGDPRPGVRQVGDSASQTSSMLSAKHGWNEEGRADLFQESPQLSFRCVSESLGGGVGGCIGDSPACSFVGGVWGLGV